MFILYWSLCCFAQVLVRCSDLPLLHARPSPLSKVYAPQLYALRSVKWEQFAQVGLNEDSSLEIGDKWFYWSSASSLELVSFVQPYLWPDAFVADLGDQIVLDTKEGRWIARLEGEGLLLAHVTANRETAPEFWESVENGCQVYMKSVNLPYVQIEPNQGVMLSFSHSDENVHIVFPRDGEVPTFFQKKSLGSWVSQKSTIKPTLAIALGEEPISLLAAGLFTLPANISLTQLKALDTKLHIGSGTQLAVFQDDFLATVPLLGWFGCPLPRWQIEWGLRKGKKIGPHRRKMIQDGRTLFVEAKKGGVRISSVESFLDIEDDGESWFSIPKENQETHFLARINIPPSLHMFVGPLEYVDLSLFAQRHTWSFVISSGTKSKALPHQLFLTYFATLQKWEKKDELSVSKDIVLALTKTAHEAHFGYFPNDVSKEEHSSLGVWKEGEQFFLEDTEGEIWMYDATSGIIKSTEHVTNH